MSTAARSQTWSQIAAWSNRLVWLYGCDLGTELKQAREEGRDLSPVEKEFARLMKVEPDAGYMEKTLGGKRGQRWFNDAMALLDRVQTLPMRKDYTYVEPSDWAEIRRQRGKAAPLPKWRGSKVKLAAKVRGGFLGRVAGCMLGKPFECMDRASIQLWGEETGNWPLQTYQREPSAAELRRIMAKQPVRPIKPGMKAFYIDRCDGFPSDDDVNYTLLGLLALKQYGRDFKPDDVAALWALQLPLGCICTAERVAYRNFIEGCLPPQSAARRNPYREWIGAQIRADFFGYAAPGHPELAAEWAWRDASISHVKNGIYGEMWVAAMLAAAFVLPTWPEIIRAGLAQIPKKSRLHEGVSRILAEHAAGADFDAILASIHREWNELDQHDWCHTISNAQVVAASLLCGGDDFSETIKLSVTAGFDTDCNGATCGSLWGIRHGDAAIPEKWLQPLKNRIRSNLRDYPLAALDGLADEVAAEAVKVAAAR
ncbi:MAG: ADP-ribosylglycohydrolase family protein [Opitutaceae bacterium]|nr:ADP-ribosylglycohydrolase family protein [Opitutaceae bacterium]